MKKYFAEFLTYTHLLSNLVARDLKLKYRRSVLGIFWSVLNPLLMMIVITAVFQNIFRVDIDNFPVYYLTGSLMFNFMSEATSLSMTSIVESAHLIKKVYVPKYIFPLEKCLFAVINMLFSSIAVFVMFLVLRYPLKLFSIFFFIPALFVLLFSIGVGLILSVANVFFRDIGHLYSVWLTAWLYLTPIIYPINLLSDKIKGVIKFNPMYYLVEFFRQVVMYGNIGDSKMIFLCFMVSFVFLILGSLVFFSNQDKFILYI